jgi:hypothetical protein
MCLGLAGFRKCNLPTHPGDGNMVSMMQQLDFLIIDKLGTIIVWSRSRLETSRKKGSTRKSSSVSSSTHAFHWPRKSILELILDLFVG